MTILVLLLTFIYWQLTQLSDVWPQLAEIRVNEYVDLITSRPVSPCLLVYVEEQVQESVMLYYFNNIYSFLFAPSTIYQMNVWFLQTSSIL